MVGSWNSAFPIINEIFSFCVFGFTLFDIAKSLEQLFVLFE